MILMGKEIGYGKPPFYVAELSQNYKNLSEACVLMKACKDAGADAIKLQTICPSELTINCDKLDFICQKGLWKGRKLWDLYKSKVSYHDTAELFAYGEELNVPVFSSVFGLESLSVLDGMGCPAYKISSFENNWSELIQACRGTGKPLLISTGLTKRLGDISGLTDIAWNNSKEIIMHCVSCYPTELKNANLAEILNLFHLVEYVGYSDHTIGYQATEYAVVLGACVIEKHVTLRSNTLDGEFSISPGEFLCMVENCNRAWEAVNNGIGDAEKDYAQYKRSIYVVEDINAGESFTNDNVRVIRPSYGLFPSYYNDLIGKLAIKDLKRGDPLRKEDVKW